MEKHVSILIPKGHSSLVNIVGTHQLFNQVNGFLKEQGKPPIFKVELVGLEKPTLQTNGLFSVNPEKHIDEISHTHLIIIPAIHDDFKRTFQQNQEFTPWLQKQYKQGAEIASLCVAAFYLASTGLLNGKQCSTHWIHASEFRRMFPKVNLVDDQIMTEDDGIYTSGGAYSYLNLLLYLVEKYAGREMAIISAKTFMNDIDKYSQSQFIMFRGQKDHEDLLIKQVQEFLEQHFENSIVVAQIAEKFAISRRSLERRFKKATNNTIIEYLQRVKIEAAKRKFETSRQNVSEVMYDVGYSDEKAFRSTFRKVTGISPVQYRNKYNITRIDA
ncbi:GlxA family transcriptional regulator [Salinimicrobium sp. GXAS 041]|uniref:GlxA family transcriptional regulator n=1 Tax=Salinimicrobium sp. GXAS 041 TaxID=3400806 RepID=UPI003C7669DC